MTNAYTSADQRKLYGALVILNRMVQEGWKLDVALDDDDAFLEPLITFLTGKGYVEVRGVHFAPTKKGRDVIEKFQEKYVTYLRGYDHFGNVDMNSGEFAISKIHEYDLETDEGWDAWQDYLCETDDEGYARFTDLRIAIACFKKIDPVEIVFMSMLNEQTFLADESDTGKDGWQFHLAMGTKFDEIDEIVESAWKEEDFDESDSDGPTGAQVLEDVIKQGTDVRKAVVEAEIAAQKAYEDDLRTARAQAAQADDNEVVEEVTYVEEVVIDPWGIDAYDVYYDPWYVDPCFAVVVYDDDWYW